jgi:putative membrane protein
MPEETGTRDRLAVERTHLANERTLLAYIRTGLAIIASGFAIVELIDSPSATPAGWIVMACGALTLVGGAVRFGSVRRRLRAQNG